jgi:two-component system, NarL family, response regulator LiaR
MVASRTIRVLLVDEHELVRSSLSTMLEIMPGIELVGQAINGRMAIEMVTELLPNVVLMDINMPVMDGLTATRLIHKQYPQTSVIVLTAFMLEADTQVALEAGACAFLRKNASMAEIEAAIRDTVL